MGRASSRAGLGETNFCGDGSSVASLFPKKKKKKKKKKNNVFLQLSEFSNGPLSAAKQIDIAERIQSAFQFVKPVNRLHAAVGLDGLQVERLRVQLIEDCAGPPPPRSDSSDSIR